MSERRSFWASIPGLVTGAAGLLTAIVGLLTVGVQLGWFGGGDGGSGPTTTTTAPGGSSTTSDGTSSDGLGGGDGGSGARDSFEVEPTTLGFAALTSGEKTVTVRNTGAGSLSLGRPEIEGTGADRFTVDDDDCTRAALGPRDTCELRVSYASRGLGGAASATMTVSAGALTQDVELRATLV